VISAESSLPDNKPYRRQLTVEELFKGAEETQQTKSIPSNVPLTVSGAKPVVAMRRKTVDTQTTSVAKPSRSQHQKMAPSVPARVPAPEIGLFQRPIRPTQVAPSTPDVRPSLMAAAVAGKQQQWQAPFRPPQHQSNVHRLALFSQSLDARMPHYERQWLNDAQYQARVFFNNMTFHSSLAWTHDHLAFYMVFIALCVALLFTITVLFVNMFVSTLGLVSRNT